jgi:hypothetical protein
MNLFEQQRSRVAANIAEAYSQTEIIKAVEGEELLKGKKANIGEIREWGGQKVQKTAQGWVPVKEGERKDLGKKEASTESSNKKEKDPIDFPNYKYEELKGGVWGDICNKVLKFLSDRRGYQIIDLNDEDKIDLAGGGLPAYKEISQFLKNYGIDNRISKESSTGGSSWHTIRINSNQIFDKSNPK